jgi:hypothetical protein
MTRRLILILGALLPSFSVNAKPRRYPVPPTLWYENSAGEKWIPDEAHLRNMTPPPEGFSYQHSQFPHDLHHSCCTVPGPEIFRGSSSWSEDLVLAMATNGGYKLSEAILIAANMCERCMNAAAHDHGLKWGYARGSAAWRQSNTECEFCQNAEATS